jgi:hypothetical protein
MELTDFLWGLHGGFGVVVDAYGAARDIGALLPRGWHAALTRGGEGRA